MSIGSVLHLLRGLCAIGVLVGCGHLAYLQWWVHPEYTSPQLFWAYWPIFGRVAVLLVVAVLIDVLDHRLCRDTAASDAGRERSA